MHKPLRSAPRVPAARQLTAALLGLLIGAAGGFSPLFADDTEVFFGQVDPDADTRPNVLFILDTSGSMQDNRDGTDTTRLAKMKAAMQEILDESRNVNVGIMRFNGRAPSSGNTGGGGAVLFPITNLEENVCKDDECRAVTLTSRVSSNPDNSEQALPSGPGEPGGFTLSMGKDGDGRTQALGLRFQDLNIPRGATITEAHLEFVHKGGNFNQTSELTIAVEASDSAKPFYRGENNISGRPLHSPSRQWRPEAWLNGNTYKTPNLATALQPLVNRSGWCGGNALALVIKGTENRSAHSFKSDAEKAPLLRVTYDPSSVPVTGGCARKTLVTSVTSDADDIEQLTGNGNMQLSSNDLEIPWNNNAKQHIGVRFSQVDLPRGARIENAKLQFEIEENSDARQQNPDLEYNVYTENTSNAEPYKSTRNDLFPNRSYLGPIAWPGVPAAAKDVRISGPDLTTHVQSIVDGADWKAGNAMAFGLQHKSGAGSRDFKSRQLGTLAAPSLRITYQGTGSAEIAGQSANFSGAGTLSARDRMKQVVNDIQAYGHTPILQTYLEGTKYVLGKPVDTGLARGKLNDRYRQHRISHPDSWSGGTVNRPQGCTESDYNSAACVQETISGSPVYISPMASSCQANHIVILSDGLATENDAISEIKQLTGVDKCAIDSGNSACGTEFANWLRDTDHSSDLQGKQGISTYTIGFNLSDNNAVLLKSLASNGAGKYYPANDALSLVNAFRSIVGNVVAEDTTFVSPGATVNQFNRLNHRNDIYFAQFAPASKPAWDGNLKRYNLGKSAAGGVEIQDMDGNPAVDPITGYFSTSARSAWLDDDQPADGKEVEYGGAASLLDVADAPHNGTRRTYTYTGGALPATLASAAHKMHEDNTAITDAMLGIQGRTGTSAERLQYKHDLIAWARGKDVRDEDEDGITAEPRYRMGDPMHSQPLIVNYAVGNEVKSNVFLATNEGYLHAVDADSGQEQYAFMPQQLLKNIDTLYQNEMSTKHPYGLDGPMSFWTDDANGNLRIDGNEKAYLFVGMRRGGRNYYALDISDRLAPKLAWVIKGGVAGTDFEELGETWSSAVPTSLMYQGSKRDVLIFGGGYDSDQDPRDRGRSQAKDDSGRGVFIVDLKTGAKLWSALGRDGGDQKFTELGYSIPSSLRVIDVDSDGLADQFYVGDMGGQVWRFDIKPYHQSSDGDLLTGGVIADLNGTGSKHHRRFYYQPDVALVARDGKRFLSVSIGSGWRAHPLDKHVDDRFYMIRQNDVYSIPAGYGKPRNNLLNLNKGYEPIVENDLADVTKDINTASTDYGWHLHLEAVGEKVLGKSVTFENTVIFTSYKPDLNVDACSTAIGSGAFYALDVFSGKPVRSLSDPSSDNDSNLTKEDRQQSLTHAGIPPEVSILITEHGTAPFVGTEPLPIGFGDQTTRTFWVDMRGQDDETTVSEATD